MAMGLRSMDVGSKWLVLAVWLSAGIAKCQARSRRFDSPAKRASGMQSWPVKLLQNLCLQPVWMSALMLGSLSASVRVEREFLQFLSEQGEILPDILGHILTIKRRRWVITCQVFAVVVFDDPPSYLIHAVDAEQLLGGNAAKQHNQGGVNQLNLLEEVERGTRVDFAFSRWTVVFWTAFDRIGDEEIAAVDPAPGQHLIQKAPGRTDERLATLVLIAAWGFANEHHTCRRHPLPW